MFQYFVLVLVIMAGDFSVVYSGIISRTLEKVKARSTSGSTQQKGSSASDWSSGKSSGSGRLELSKESERKSVGEGGRGKSDEKMQSKKSTVAADTGETNTTESKPWNPLDDVIEYMLRQQYYLD
jgi:hypothetical protein